METVKESTEFEGKVAIVTGSARGIGKATVEMLARRGATVVVSDVLEDAGKATVEGIVKFGGQATFIACDVSSEEQIVNLMRQTRATYGRLDILVNNAGVEGRIAETIDSDVASFDRLVSINLRGLWLCIKHAVPIMLESGAGGAIVNLASLAGHVGFAGLGPYVMSKHGVVGLTKVVAIEYSKQGIRTNAVSPGCIQTNMIDALADELGAPSADEALAHLHPIGRLGDVDEVAEAIVWLCSAKSSNVTGTALSVDGGFISQ